MESDLALQEKETERKVTSLDLKSDTALCTEKTPKTVIDKAVLVVPGLDRSVPQSSTPAPVGTEAASFL